MEPNRDAQAQQEQALFLENLRDTLSTPYGYAVILNLLDAARLFSAPGASPEEYRLRLFFHEFFQEIEEADPAAALRLFARCRGIALGKS
jgi:hypothetical protein